MQTAHLASSIFIVARRREGDGTGDYMSQVRPAIQEIVAERVNTLFGLGISGSDLVIAAVGAGLRAYTQFRTVELPNGEELGEEAFLDEVQREVLDLVLAQVMHVDRAGVGAVDRPTRFYVLGRYEYGSAAVEFGEANILAKGIGVELDGPGGLSERPTPLVKKTKDTVTLLDYTARGDREELGLPANGVPARLVDVLHRLLWLIEEEPATVAEFLTQAQPDAEKLRLVAQALAGQPLGRSASGGNGTAERTREQQALDRLLAAWRRVVEETLFTRGGRG
jgi:putative DNA methylase